MRLLKTDSERLAFRERIPAALAVGASVIVLALAAGGVIDAATHEKVLPAAPERVLDARRGLHADAAGVGDAVEP